MNQGNIPVLMVQGVSLAETWEKSLLALYNEGCEIETQYDKPGDRLSRDCTMTMVVEQPMSDPMIHRAFPGGLEDLEEYRQEVVDGIKDHWVRDPNDPADTRWDYTYHERLAKYTVTEMLCAEENVSITRTFDQIQWMVDKLVECGYTRRANIVTWQPWRDMEISDPPCLQSIWCRMLPDESGIPVLNMNVRFRSRDAYQAAFMNMFAFIELQRKLCVLVALRLGGAVMPGRYVDTSDSYHIYGKDLDMFEDGFLKLVKTRTFEDRTWTRAFAEPFFEEAKPKIVEKVKAVDEGRKG